jgi:hypothetical protein
LGEKSELSTTEWGSTPFLNSYQQGHPVQRASAQQTEKNNTSSLTQRDETDPRVWIVFKPILLLVVVGTFLAFFRPGPLSPETYLITFLFDGLASIIIALAVKKFSRKLSDLPKSELDDAL